MWWLENPGENVTSKPWVKHKVTDQLDSATLIDIGDVNKDGLVDIVAPVDLLPVGDEPKKRAIRIAWRQDADGRNWKITDIQTPPRTGQPKAATTGDVNGDGKIDIVVTSSGATDGQMGTYWIEYRDSAENPDWRVHRIAGPQGSSTTWSI